MTLSFAATAELHREAERLADALGARGIDAVPRSSTGAEEGADVVEAVRAGRVDFGLVSAGAARRLPSELHVGAVLERDEPRDVLVSCGGHAWTLRSLPRGARVGVAGPRRRGFLLAHRNDVVPVPPGNGAGPAEALDSGGVDALVLASAEARRAGLSARVSEVLDAKAWMPAPGQGALVLVCRHGDAEAHTTCASMDHPAARAALEAETAAAGAQGGSREESLGALAMPHGTWIRVWGMAASADGRRVVRGDVTGRTDDPVGAGRALAELLRARGIAGLDGRVGG